MSNDICFVDLYLGIRGEEKRISGSKVLTISCTFVNNHLLLSFTNSFWVIN